MDDPHDDTELIVSRLTPSKNVVALVLIAIVVAGPLAGAASGFSQIDPFGFGYAEDFEDGEVPDEWSGTLTSGSYEDTYSLDVGGVGFEDVELNPEPGNPVEVHVLQNMTGNQNQMFLGSDSTNGVSLAYDTVGDSGVELRTSEGGDFQRVDITGDTSWQDTWYNTYIETNGTYTQVWLWEAGQTKPDNPALEGDTSAVDPWPVTSMEWATTFSDALVDEIGISAIPPTGIEGTVTNTTGAELSDVTVEASQDGTVIENETTGDLGQYQLAVENGTYNVTASKEGYFPITEEVTVSGEIVTRDFQLEQTDSALRIDTRPYIEHGESVPYQVVFTQRNGTGEDVTDQATVSSQDTDVVVVNTLTNRLEATENTSVNERIFVTGQYTDSEGDTYNATANVTVANKTVDNLGILPAWTSVSAVIGGGTDDNPGDRTFLLILIGTALAAAVSRIATSLAGLGALTSILLMGWILGMTNDGLAIVTVLTAMFIGMNVAGNVDYQVRK